MTKSIFKSKTAWANFALAVIVGAGSAFNIGFLQDAEVVGYATAGINVLLRLISKDPVSVTRA